MRSPLVAISLLAGALPLASADEFEELGHSFAKDTLPLLERFCLDCHEEATQKGELDLERFGTLADIRADPATWQKVAEQLELGEMPPLKEGRTPPSAEERESLIRWTRRYLHTEARTHAGDPGPVLLRRLSNAEYSYTIRDLTGVAALDPLREFPVDSASGEGFTNSGSGLVMSPALLEKYLEAGKEIASHAVLLPEGIRFSAATTRSDQSREILDEIRELYLEATGGSEIDNAYRGEVRGARDGNEGRVDPEPYLAALLAHREQLLEDPTDLPQGTGLNPRYLGALASMLASDSSESFLLDHLRRRWRTAGDASAITAEIARWQGRLWRFNKVGHLGLVRPWQEPVNPLQPGAELRLKIGENLRSLRLLTEQVSGGNALAQWQNPRFEREGEPPVLLRDLQRGYAKLNEIRATVLASTSTYLRGVAQLRKQGEKADPVRVAKAHGIDPEMLRAWASHLGITNDAPEISGLLTEEIARAGDHEFVKGWTLPGVADFSLLGNASDTDVRIPGELRAHRIVVHPRPERQIAAGWRSPIDGNVKLAPSIRDAHDACGNGVRWSLELRRGDRREVLQSGDVDLGKTAAPEPLGALAIRKGDLLSLLIDARDESHICDLTEIDLAVEEVGGAGRGWSLSGDCADNLLQGNPHPDGLGNPAVWYFYGVLSKDSPPAPSHVPLLEKWLTEADAKRREELALALQEELCADPPAGAYAQLISPSGPLFSHLDLSELAGGAIPEGFDADGNLAAGVPSSLEFPIPAALEGAEFVVRGVIGDSSDPTALVRMQAAPATNSALVVRADQVESSHWREAFDSFRELFPAAMCYPRIVPADEVVTLLLHHREDEHLRRLLLSEDETARLDRLWTELEFISQEPLHLVTVYEQIWQFSTQDGDPKFFEPMEARIRERAEAFEKALRAAEPEHVDALFDLAPTIYRRPLTESETRELRAFHLRLREEGHAHAEAVRLVLARLLTAPAFLYKPEVPGPGKESVEVSSWELASRLSYFLTSAGPGEELRAAAAGGSLLKTPVLLEHTDRLLRDPRARRLAREFACQWLHIRDFEWFDEKNEQLYPEFVALRGGMAEEAVLFFADLFQNNRSILSLLDADHSFVDAGLAEFYGLPAVNPDGWARVEGLREQGRGGILGMAAILARQSGASRTSPTLRGNWISETLLGERTPRPPANVPQLPEIVPESLSDRELITRHSEDPACARCHARIDPYGFALEGFDAIGRGRGGADTTATLPDGAEIEGIEGLRDYLLTSRRDAFVRQFCQKLLGYSLGRAVQLSDAPLLEEIEEALAREEYRVGTAIRAIVQSRQFREIRGVQSQIPNQKLR